MYTIETAMHHHNDVPARVVVNMSGGMFTCCGGHCFLSSLHGTNDDGDTTLQDVNFIVISSSRAICGISDQAVFR